MEIIKFSLNKQKISLIDCPIIASNSKDYLYASFELESDDWVKPIIAIFISEEKVPFSVTLDDDNMCKVPWEVLQYGNKVEVSAVCGDLHTATSVTFSFENSGYRNGNEPLKPTPTIWSELSKKIDSKQDKLIAGSITTDNIANKAVTMEKLADDVTNQLSELKDDIGDRNITLDFNHVGYIDKKGKLSTLVTSFKTTDFIAISSRVIVKGEFRDLNSPLYYINCYDSNKNYLGGTINAISSGNKIVNVNGVVTLIEGTCFIRVTNSHKSISMVKMEYSLSDTGDLSLVNQKIEKSKTNNSIYSNIINDGLGFSVFSKFASVGDSLSVGYNTEKDGTPISEDLKHSW